MDSQKPKKDYLIDDASENVKPMPRTYDADYTGSGRLEGKNALVIGGDSGIGRAVAILFAQEGAYVTFTYYENEDDAIDTQELIDRYSSGEYVQLEVGDEGAVIDFISQIDEVDIFVYNPAEQHFNEEVSDLVSEQVHRVFQTNVFGAFYFLINGSDKIAEDGVIIFTTSVTAFDGSPTLLEYSATKGALTTLMRSLSQHEDILAKNIRVNAVAPGPIWTPLIPATIPNFDENWGKDTTLEGYAHPVDVAYTYLYLADDKQRYVTGQTLHVNGKKVS